MAKRRAAKKPKTGAASGARAAVKGAKRAMSAADRVKASTGVIDVSSFGRGPTGGKPSKGR